MSIPNQSSQHQTPSLGLQWSLAPDFTPGAKAPAWQIDALISLLLGLWGLVFYFTGLEVLEFFRHTEADRTLIGWEMFRRGEYIVPHLLEAVILTKPPLFYWLVALAIELTGTAEEWAPRLPSALAALVLLISQYLVLRRVGCTWSSALFGALMVGTGGALFVLCGAAEIDMVFGLFCALSLYAMYFSALKPESGVVLSYVFAAGAFLTKGPPVVLFYGAAFVCFIAWRLCFSGEDESKNARGRFWYLMLQHVWGVLVFVSIVGLWLLMLGSKVGFDVLAYELEEEVVNRVVQSSSRNRGPFFYLGALASGLAPWTLFAVVGLALPAWSKFPITYRSLKTNNAYWSFFIFNVVVVVTAFLMLSLAEGKSNRYIFPVYPFAMNLALFGWMQLRGTKVLGWLSWAAMVFVAHLAGAALILPFWSKLEMVPMQYRVVAAVLIFAGALGLALALRFKPLPKVLLATLMLLLIGIRYGYTHVFAETRNAKRTVKPVAMHLEEALPSGERLYTIEMFERWVVYYMIREGRSVARLTPSRARELADEPGDAYLLLQVAQETWRLTQLSLAGAKPEVVAEIKDTRDPLILVKTPKASLKHLTLQRRAPTDASPIPESLVPESLVQPNS